MYIHDAKKVVYGMWKRRCKDKLTKNKGQKTDQLDVKFFNECCMATRW